MLRHILLSASLLASTLAGAQSLSQSASAIVLTDTLLSASKANRIEILTTAKIISVKVTKIDDTANDFFFESGNQEKHSSKALTQVISPSVTDIIVCQSSDDVKVSFKNSDGEQQNYTLAFPDPDNRSISSYIGSHGSDFGFTISRKGSGTNSIRWECITQGLSFGWATPIKETPDLDMQMRRCHEFSWNMILGVKMSYRAQSLSCGVGIRHLSFTTKGPRFFNKHSDGTITLDPYSDDQHDRKSSLSLFSVQVPLLYGVNFGHHRNWGLKLGPIANFNTGGHIKTRYSFEGSDYNVRTGHISQRKVTFDGIFMVNYQCIGLYARYSPMKLLNSRTGLDFGSFSTGIMFPF